jgi:hypothetical protein
MATAVAAVAAAAAVVAAVVEAAVVVVAVNGFHRTCRRRQLRSGRRDRRCTNAHHRCPGDRGDGGGVALVAAVVVAAADAQTYIVDSEVIESWDRF